MRFASTRPLILSSVVRQASKTGLCSLAISFLPLAVNEEQSERESEAAEGEEIEDSAKPCSCFTPTKNEHDDQDGDSHRQEARSRRCQPNFVDDLFRAENHRQVIAQEAAPVRRDVTLASVQR
jgi:hypothetical protein